MRLAVITGAIDEPKNLTIVLNPRPTVRLSCGIEIAIMLTIGVIIDIIPIPVIKESIIKGITPPLSYKNEEKLAKETIEPYIRTDVGPKELTAKPTIGAIIIIANVAGSNDKAAFTTDRPRPYGEGSSAK
jgi:hypothetical protein